MFLVPSRSDRRTHIVHVRMNTDHFPLYFSLFFYFFTAIVTISRAQLDVVLLCRSAIERTYNSLVKEKSHLIDNANLLPIQVNFKLEADNIPK